MAAAALCAGTAASAQEGTQPAAGADLVFFDWGKPAISQDAAATLDRIAEAYRADPSAKLELAGHTDRSGPERANIRSARLRAEAVRSYLAEKGVAANAMQVVSYGESQPLVPTEDGVREAQNRRVEIRRIR
jgi:outer membrane protein OmpA-like peptidoglycan-associated protein